MLIKVHASQYGTIVLKLAVLDIDDDEDATIRITQYSRRPDDHKQLPRPPRPPRADRTDSTPPVPTSLPTWIHKNEIHSSNGIALQQSDSLDPFVPGNAKQSKNSSIGPQASSNISIDRSIIPLKADSSRPMSSVPDPDDGLEIGTPSVTMSATTSSSSAYHLDTPFESQQQCYVLPMPELAPLPSYDMTVSEPWKDVQLQKSTEIKGASSFTELQAKTLLQARGDDGPSHARASVYTAQTSVSDWAREREMEMRSSRSGVFDLELELHDHSSSSSSQGHGSRSSLRLSRINSVVMPPSSAFTAANPPDSVLQSGRSSTFSSSSESIIAISEPPSPAVVIPTSNAIQASATNSRRNAANNPPSSTSRSATSVTGFGLGITSDNTIHTSAAAAAAAPSRSGSFSRRTPTDQHSPSLPLEGTANSRWSVDRNYTRRSTVSSVRVPSRKHSQASLIGSVTNSSKPDLLGTPSTSSISGLQSPRNAHDRGSTTASSDNPDQSSLPFTQLHHGRDADSSEQALASSLEPAAVYAQLDILSSRTRSTPSSEADHESEPQDLATSAQMKQSRSTSVWRLSEWSDISLPELQPHETRPISQAVALAESGKGHIFDIGLRQPLEHLAFPVNTTHLLLAGTQQPLALVRSLATGLPSMGDKLVVLDISRCSLDHIPETIFLCSNLEELNISHNTVSSGTLPAFISSLLSLRVLLADACGLTSIIHQFGNLPHLHTVALRHNSFNFLPSWFCHLSETLECLLLDDNPLFADYADLLRLCHQHPTSPTTVQSSPFAASEICSPAAATASASHPTILQSIDSTRSSRVSLASRASSVRLHFMRNNADMERPMQSASPVQSLLLADNASQASTVQRRTSILRPMKSTSDLNSPQPSLLELISSGGSPHPVHPPVSPAMSNSTVSSSELLKKLYSNNASPTVANPTSRKSFADNFTLRRTRKSSRAMTAMECLAFDTQESREKREEFTPSGAQITQTSSPQPTPAAKGTNIPDQRQGFFRKMSFPKRKKANSIVGHDHQPMSLPTSPMLSIERADLGVGRPPFFNDSSSRSVSEPMVEPMDITQTNVPVKTAPHSEPIVTWQQSLQSNFRSDRRSRKQSRAPIPVSLLNTPSAENGSKASKRRSFLLLDDFLPPLLSPGPLFVSFGHENVDDATLHAKARLKTLEEEGGDAARAPSTCACYANQNDRPALDLDDAPNMPSRKQSLAPLMAYLQDLHDLGSSHGHSRGGTMGPELLTRQPRRKSSSAAVSVVSSSRPDRSSGYASSKGESTGLTTPSSVHTQPSRVRDDATKREVCSRVRFKHSFADPYTDVALNRRNCLLRRKVHKQHASSCAAIHRASIHALEAAIRCQSRDCSFAS